MPGKPAARVGDMTAHGGSIVGPGAPTVMIGGKPAAVVGDMHVCPMVTPGVPPVPHVGGPVLPPGAPTVLIMKKPAVCVGDMATCTGPPDTILPPGCPTVLIGSGGGGGGAGGPGSGGGGAKAKAAESKVEEGHYLDVKFTDKAGKPITGVGYTVKGPDGASADGVVTGQVKKSGVEQGSYEIAIRAITKAEWSTEKAMVGDKVKLIAETAGVPAGEKAEMEIFVKDLNAADHLLEKLEAQVQGDKIEGEWELAVDGPFLEDQDAKRDKGAYVSPKFYFIVKAAGLSARSKILSIKDYFEMELKDEDGKPVGGAKYRAVLPDGTIKEGTLDSNGYAKLKKVPPGRVEVTFSIE